jgi:hypothetical protein
MLNVLENTPEFFHRKPNGFNKQKEAFAKSTTVTTKTFHASFKVAYRNAKCKEPHSIEGLVSVTCCS